MAMVIPDATFINRDVIAKQHSRKIALRVLKGSGIVAAAGLGVIAGGVFFPLILGEFAILLGAGEAAVAVAVGGVVDAAAISGVLTTVAGAAGAAAGGAATARTQLARPGGSAHAASTPEPGTDAHRAWSALGLVE